MLFQPAFSATWAEAYGSAGRAEEGLARLADGIEVAEKTSDHWAESELHRVHGELLLMRGGPDAQVEAWFHQALDVARSQEAKSFELRAATSLARLWQRQGKRAEARDLLGEIYGWFTEGFDTADLKDAKALLEELA